MKDIYLYLIFIVIFVVCPMSVAYLIHGPWIHISKKQKADIQKNGLYHFTSPSVLHLIQKNGLKGGPSHMRGPELLLGNLVWTYQTTDPRGINGLHETLCKKKRCMDDPSKCAVCLKLTNLTDTELKRLNQRRGFDGDRAVVYLGDFLKPAKIEVVALWNPETNTKLRFTPCDLKDFPTSTKYD